MKVDMAQVRKVVAAWFAMTERERKAREMQVRDKKRNGRAIEDTEDIHARQTMAARDRD